MERLLYLALDIGAVAVPFLFSFHPRIRFDKQWKAFLPGSILVAALFIVWDAAFTAMGIWGFNERYLIGTGFFGLPLEEWLFFLCIPYACVFTYFVFGTLRPDPWGGAPLRSVSAILALSSLVVAATNMDRWYTSTTFLGLCAVMGFLWLTKAPYLGRALLSYAVILLPFFLINGILTGSFIEEEVVWYNDAENLGVRLGTIPVEDIFYGMLLILMNVALFERRRSSVQ